jgi:hypothetical protein
MWPGVAPRVGLPLSLAGMSCYAWLLAELHPRAAVVWVGFVVLVAVIAVGLAVRRWRLDTRVAEVLAGRPDGDPELMAEVDRIARRLDDSSPYSAWLPPLAVAFIGLTGARAAIDRSDWLFVVPLVGVALYAVAGVVLLRRRNRQVTRWLSEHPREPGWRSVPPV